MPDLVPEHAREVRLIAKERHDATRPVDEPARESKRVDRRRVDDGETPRQLGTVRARHKRETDLLHVAPQPIVVAQPQLAPDLDIGLAAQCDFLRLAHQHELAIPGHRVNGAAGERQY